MDLEIHSHTRLNDEQEKMIEDIAEDVEISGSDKKLVINLDQEVEVHTEIKTTTEE